MTKRQKAYRLYLKTDHWKLLCDSAKERDGNQCVICSSSRRLQVHHKFYRGRLEDGVLSDVETLCRKCHRLEHGLGPNDFESKCLEIKRYFGYARRPPPADWKELKSLMSGHSYEIEWFSELMFQFVMHVFAHEREQFASEWWMDKSKTDFWFRRAFDVRKSIQERMA